MRKLYVIEETCRVSTGRDVIHFRHNACQNLYFTNLNSAIAKAELMASEDGDYKPYTPKGNHVIKAWRYEFIDGQGHTNEWFLKVYECEFYI